MELFGDRIKSDFIDKTRVNSNLSEWEKTFLKTFSRYKSVFLKNKAVFYLHGGTPNNLLAKSSSLVDDTMEENEDFNSQ